ncbi:MAG: hypothetical protein H6832_06515 [Planctomycetes bacterium]|nr:hypothetical protein [Planctomycetota bacterium]MCB9918040.1 hypothetical protein [Planctomycetota bacterium]
MTLPESAVLDVLADDFVVGWEDIRDEDFCGVSSGYNKRQTAVGTTNGAGGRNVQIFVLSPDERVLLLLPGFWHPDDLLHELSFAKVLHRLWADDTKPLAEKVRLWRRLHAREPMTHSVAMRARSDWQSFDRSTELAKARTSYRDSITEGDNGETRLLAIDELVHQRMVHRPFVPYARFDIENFVDYGRRYYDLNRGHDRGKVFTEVRRREAKRKAQS